MNSFRKSFKAAFRGTRYAFRHERNFRIEIYIAILVILAMIILQVSGWHVVILAVMIAWVLAMELVNTATERIVDILKPRIHPYARVIKDLMAAAVLLSTCGAATIGLIVLLPYVIEFIKLIIYG